MVNKRGLKKGHTNNPNGRPKGTPNKVTGEMRKWLQSFLDNNREQIEEDFRALDPPQRLQMFERLLQYTLPKMQSVRAKIDLNDLTEHQLDLVIDEITQDLEKE